VSEWVSDKCSVAVSVGKVIPYDSKKLKAILRF
jgi:hypothetical protein